jgi:hypothetical protein
MANAQPMERAYCLYQLHREEEALVLLHGSEPREAALAAQIKHRLGACGEGAKLFQQAESDGGSSSELCTNILAALVGAERFSEALTHAESSLASVDASRLQFEFYYNYACAAIGARQFPRAQELIKKALTMCRHTLSADGYSEEEIEVECPSTQQHSRPPRLVR